MTTLIRRAPIAALLAIVVAGCEILEPRPVDPAPETPRDVTVEPVAPRPVRFANPPYLDLVVETFGDLGGDYDVDVSPDGSFIAYSSTRHSTSPSIFTKELGAGGPQEKTTGPHRDIHPKISPDGEWIAFASDREGNFDIWIVPRAKSAAPWHLTTSSSDEIHPTWSPDGKEISYCARETGGQWFLWVVDVESGRRRQLGPGLYPEWSPDGEWIAFQRPSRREPGWHGIWIVPVRGGAPQEIVTEPNWAAIQPSWSPNSKSLVYATARLEIREADQPLRADDLWIVSLDGRRYQLTESPSPDYAPAWGLNGRIYFTTDRSGSPRVCSVRPGFDPFAMSEAGR